MTSMTSHGKSSMVDRSRASVVSHYSGRPTSSTLKEAPLIKEEVIKEEEEVEYVEDDTEELIDVDLDIFSKDGEGGGGDKKPSE